MGAELCRTMNGCVLYQLCLMRYPYSLVNAQGRGKAP